MIIKNIYRILLYRIPFISPVINKADNYLRQIKFLCLNRKINDIRLSFQGCSTVEEYLNFARRIFAPHQCDYEIINFLKFVATNQPKYVCEIGVADGGTNFLLSQSLSSVTLMIGVDLFVRNRMLLRYFSKPQKDLFYLNGSSYNESTFNKVASILENRKLDLLFIDGDHSYEGVQKDFLLYRQLVKEGGHIAFHDIIPDYLTRFGKQTGRYAGGVPVFWNKIKKYYPYNEFIENSEQDGLGIGVIQYSLAVALPEDP